MIFAVFEASITLNGKIVIAVPIVGDLSRGFGAEQIERRCPWKCNHAQAAIYRLNIHDPISGVSTAMEVAVIDQDFDRQAHCAAANQLVSYVCGVCFLLHPNALFDKRIVKSNCPNGRRALKVKSFDKFESQRVNGSAQPSIRAQGKSL